MATAVAKNYFLFMISIRCAYTGVCIKVKKKIKIERKEKKTTWTWNKEMPKIN
jgi:hypothetical protein